MRTQTDAVDKIYYTRDINLLLQGINPTLIDGISKQQIPLKTGYCVVIHYG